MRLYHGNSSTMSDRPPYLTDAEVDDICAGYRQSAAKVRFFAEVLQVPVRRKPNGRPLVLRADLERTGAASAASNEPNWSRKA